MSLHKEYFPHPSQIIISNKSSAVLFMSIAVLAHTHTKNKYDVTFEITTCSASLTPIRESEHYIYKIHSI